MIVTGLALPADAEPDCANASGLCHKIFDWTGQAWLADGSYWLLVKPAKILLIIMVAMLARYLIHRSIRRLVKSTADGGVPTILKPLREALPTGLLEATSVFPERRSQRAMAIGSVLRSAATMIIYAVAFMLILKELNVDLAPLLASAGIAGIALGFGAQSLVKDVLAGLFMLLEDQYGVGDIIDIGETVGTVEAVGLRVTTIRDLRGVVWYVRNGEIAKVGNKSQGWASIVVDMPIGFVPVEDATAVMQAASAELASDPLYANDFLDAPEVVGVEHVGVEGAVVRTMARVRSEDGPRMSREIRRRLSEALEAAGLTSQIAATRRPVVRPDLGQPSDPGGAT